MRRLPSCGRVRIFVAALWASAVPWAAVDADALFDERWRLSGQAVEPLEAVPHRAVYALPLSYNERAPEEMVLPAGPAQVDRAEFIYQLSAKVALATDLRAGRGDLWFGYTQKGWWQAYNRREANFIRETTHEPEVIYAHRPGSDVFGVVPRLLTVRLNHVSDGRGRHNSRSFNRLGAGLLFDDGQQAIYYRAWYPLPAGGSVEGDQIADYYGRVQVDWYRANGAATWHVRLRNNLRLDDNRTSLSVGYSAPTPSPHLHAFIEYRRGYGDGLIDYNQATNRLSVGAMLVRWH